jgi:peptidyl-tRNA hydrolase, PTH1 family
MKMLMKMMKMTQMNNNNMKLIIGLGNPGMKYKKTRHNFGWLVLDKIAGKNKWQTSKKGKLDYVKMEINNQTVELIKPQTYMNNSGQAIAYAQKKHDFKPEDIIIIHDELALPFGAMRIGQFESAGGHNGIKSTIQHLGFNNFIRFRLGIQNELVNRIPAEKFVLTRFNRDEKKQLETNIDTCVDALELYLEKGLEPTMNKYN